MDGGEPALVSWITGFESISIHHTGHTNAHSGRFSVDLAGYAAPGSVSQTIVTQPGQWYVLSFWRAGHAYHPYTGSAKMEVLWNGSSQGVLEIEPALASNAMNWTYTEYVLLAQGAATQLTLHGRSPNGSTIIDDVSVSAVPEPSAAALWLAGMSALMGLMHIRSRFAT